MLFDPIGGGGSDAAACEDERHASLDGCARDVVLVGRSTGARIGLLASIQAPDRLAKLVLVGPSAHHVNDPRRFARATSRSGNDDPAARNHRRRPRGPRGLSDDALPAAAGRRRPARPLAAPTDVDPSFARLEALFGDA